jgi:hypothetical protein
MLLTAVLAYSGTIIGVTVSLKFTLLDVIFNVSY